MSDPNAKFKFCLHRFARTTEEAAQINAIVDREVADRMAESQTVTEALRVACHEYAVRNGQDCNHDVDGLWDCRDMAGQLIQYGATTPDPASAVVPEPEPRSVTEALPHPTLSQPWGDPDYDHTCELCRQGVHGRLMTARLSATPTVEALRAKIESALDWLDHGDLAAAVFVLREFLVPDPASAVVPERCGARDGGAMGGTGCDEPKGHTGYHSERVFGTGSHGWPPAPAVIPDVEGPQTESWRDEGIIESLRDGKPLGSFARARAVELVEAAIRAEGRGALDVERLRSNVLRLHRWDVAQGWNLLNAIIAEFDDVLALPASEESPA